MIISHWKNRFFLTRRRTVSIGIAVVVVIFLAGFLIFHNAEAAWYNNSWAFRKKLTFNNAAQSANLTNFPVMVTLSADNFDFKQAKSAGEDIRFTDSDGTTLLGYEIEKWDSASKTAIIWVNVPQIDASSNQDFIYAYWGNPDAADAQSADNTWNSNYKGVYHLDDNAASTTITDSSGNSNTITAGQNTDKITSSSGKIAGSVMSLGTPGYPTNPTKTNYSDIWPDIVLDSSGFPVIAYTDYTNYDLVVMHCNDKECVGGDESINTVDSTGTTGYYPSIQLDSNGYPVIAYYDASGLDLELAHCNDANCAGGDENLNTVDSTGTVGNYQSGTSMVLDGSGYPVIAYNDDTNNDLKVAHCNDANCAGSDESLTAPLSSSANDTGTYSKSILLDGSGYPMIAYLDLTNTDLMYLHCDDVNCAGDETSRIVTVTTTQVLYMDMQKNSSGIPTIIGTYSAYPRVFACSDTNCSTDTETYLTLYNQYGASFPSFVFDANNNIYLVNYSRGKTGDYDVNFYTTYHKMQQAYDSDYDFGTGSFSVSAWFKSNGKAEQNFLLSRYDSDQGYKIWLNYAGEACFGIDDDSSFGPDDSACSSNSSIQTNVDNGNATTISFMDMNLDTSGYPVIAYYDATGLDLELIHCNDANCTGSNENFASIDSTGDVGYSPSLILDASGYPVIAYHDNTSNDLKVVHCGNANCSSGNTINTIDSADDVGDFPTIKLDASGYPVIAYYDTTNTAVKLVHCNDANCSGGDESIVTLVNDEDDRVRQGSESLQLDGSGYPMVVYYDATNIDLKYIHCNDVNCAGSDETKTTIETSGSTGDFASMKLDSSGYPVIAYMYGSGLDLKLVHCGNANCSSGNTTSTVSSINGADAGYYDIDLALNPATGNPVIVHSNLANFSFFLTVCNDVNCAGSDETTSLIRDNSYSYLYSSLELDSNNYPVIAFSSTGNDLQLIHLSNATTYSETNTYDDNTWHHLVAVKNGSSSITLYIDGASVGSDASLAATGTLTSNSATFNLLENLDNGLSDYNWTGSLDEVQIDSSARSASWVAAQYLSETNTFINQGLVEERDGPAGYWKFDEGTGATVHDATTQGNNGTITNASWVADDQCIAGKCLHFDGSGDSVSVADPANATLDPTTALTIEAWINPKTDGENSLARIVSNVASVDLYVQTDDNNAVSLCAETAGTADTCTGSDSIPLNRWSHVAVAYTDNNTRNFYINGQLVATNDSSNSLTNDSAAKVIGDIVGGTRSFDGYIDDLKVYDYARSAAQIKTDFTSSGTNKGASASFGGSNVLGIDDDKLASGLIGYWKMDDNVSGNSQTLTDASGNGLNLTTFWGANSSGMDCTIGGKFGYGCSLDGTDDYIRILDNDLLDLGTGDYTFSAWVNPASNPAVAYIVRKSDSGNTNGYQIYGASGIIRVALNSGTILAQSTTTLSTGIWQQVTVTFDRDDKVHLYINGTEEASGDISSLNGTDLNAAAALFLSYSSSFWNGKIDQTRIYNRALSPVEVRTLYDSAPGPVVYYNLDENTGTASVNDTSGNANTATMTGSMTSADWVPGKYGSALDFDGTDDALTVATASDSYVDFNGSEAFSGGAWVYVKTMPGSGNQDGIITKYDETSTLRGYRLILENDDADTTGNFQVDIYDESADQTITATGANDTVNPNTWYHVAFTFNGGTAGAAGDLKLYTNSVLTGSNSSNASFLGLEDVAVDFNVGDYDATDAVANNTAFTGVIDDVRVYNYARTQKQIVEDLNAGHPAGGSPVGSQVLHFQFNEGVGATANNSGSLGASLKGIISGPSWSNNGKFGKTLSFDNSDDRVYLADNDSLDPRTGSFTGSAWIKVNSATTPHDIIIQKGANQATAVGYWFGITTSGTLDLGISDGSSYLVNFVQSNTNVGDNAWHYVAFTWDPALGATIYVDGKKDKFTAATSSVDFNSTSVLNIGGYSAATFTVDGLIDEVKIYNFALSEDSIKTDYNQGKSAVLGALGTNPTYAPQAANQEYCVPGDTTSCASPVGEWKMDENTGVNAYDTSGNSNNGALGVGSSVPTWTVGKIGSALNFDGTDDLVNAGSATTLDDMSTISVTAWVYARGAGETLGRIIDKSTDTSASNGYIIGVNGAGTVTLRVDHGATDLNCNGSVVDINSWSHITITWDGTANCSGVLFYKNGVQVSTSTTTNGGAGRVSDADQSLIIGNNSATDRTFDGKIDNLKLYNYVRSPAQVAWEYNRGGPVGWWKLDECQDGTLYDASGKGNNGTWYGTGGGTQTAVGSCTTASTAWGNGATGKFNSSLNFDGTDDYVDIPDQSYLRTTTQSFSFWFKSSTAPAVFGGVISHTNNADGYNVLQTSSGKIRAYRRISGNWRYVESKSSVTDGAWHHGAAIYDGTTISFYINGLLQGTDTDASATDFSNTNYLLGKYPTTYYFTGQIDDVGVFNYALTATQVKTLYNSGAVRFNQ